MEKKHKQKKSEQQHIDDLERLNYKTALEAVRTLDSINRTTERTRSIVYEQREELEEIRREVDTIQDNVIKGKELSVKMKRAGKLITIGDKIGDKIKGIFKPAAVPRKQQLPLAAPTTPKSHANSTTPLALEEAPTEESTNKVLLSIRDGLKDLQVKLKQQEKEIEEQVPIIEEIIEINKNTAQETNKVMKNLRRI